MPFSALRRHFHAAAAIIFFVCFDVLTAPTAAFQADFRAFAELYVCYAIFHVIEPLRRMLSRVILACRRRLIRYATLSAVAIAAAAMLQRPRCRDYFRYWLSFRVFFARLTPPAASAEATVFTPTVFAAAFSATPRSRALPLYASPALYLRLSQHSHARHISHYLRRRRNVLNILHEFLSLRQR
jgi:hypothetical protein